MSTTNPHPEVTASVIFITPEKASDLIEANIANQRGIKRTNLTRIENGFRKDAYVLNGESIIQSVTKRILDGQHRLHACINTRVGFWTVFVTGVPDEYFPTIDSGRSRSFADVLKIRGEELSNSLAPSAQRLGEYVKSKRSVGSGTPLSNQELNDIVEMSPGLVASVRLCKRALSGLVPSACVAWLHYVATDGGCGEKMEEFINSLGTGAMLPEDSPIYWLRRRLEVNRLAKAKLPSRDIIALIVKGWNAWAAGASVKQLKWTAGEQFPEPIIVPVGRGRDTNSGSGGKS